MRISVTLDDDCYAQACRYTGIHESSALLRYALARLVEREATKCLINLRGSSAQLLPVPRRQTDPADHSE